MNAERRRCRPLDTTTNDSVLDDHIKGDGFYDAGSDPAHDNTSLHVGSNTNNMMDILKYRRHRPLDERTATTIRTKNRRQEYLERNPQYFEASDLELADPLQYDQCIRRFQSAAEREADGKKKGWSGVLEADLYRSEAKIAAVQAAKSAALDSVSEQVLASAGDAGYEDAPNSRGQGLERWKYNVTMRFLHGLDPDFAYKEVDENDDLDEKEHREAQDRWFEDEEPEWVYECGSSKRVGETGVQDF